jgi:hypothetical protein
MYQFFIFYSKRKGKINQSWNLMHYVYIRPASFNLIFLVANVQRIIDSVYGNYSKGFTNS